MTGNLDRLPFIVVKFTNEEYCDKKTFAKNMIAKKGLNLKKQGTF